MEEKNTCDVDDILCQIEALRSLRSLRSALGNENFAAEFPELSDLDYKLIDKIQTTKGNIREALTKCGNIDLEDSIPEMAELEEMDDFEEED